MDFPDFEKDRQAAYEDFARRYELPDAATLAHLYDINELNDFLPPQPNEEQKAIIQKLAGLEGMPSGYLDYRRSNNTFELLMQYTEATGQQKGISFIPKDRI